MHANVVQMSGTSKDDAINLITPPSTPPKKKKRKLCMEMPRRRSSRARGLNQLVIKQNTPRNGNCLYLAVLSATRDKGIEPGKSLTTASDLRMAIFDKPILPDYLTAEIKLDVMDRIYRGMTTGSSSKKKASVGRDAWAGEEEIYMIATLYKLDIVVVNFQENRVCNATDFTDKSRQIILAYDGEHYDWCKLPDRTTVDDLMKSVTKKNIYLKF
mgnify:CR=1 FL=1